MISFAFINSFSSSFCSRFFSIKVSKWKCLSNLIWCVRSENNDAASFNDEKSSFHDNWWSLSFKRLNFPSIISLKNILLSKNILCRFRFNSFNNERSSFRDDWWSLSFKRSDFSSIISLKNIFDCFRLNFKKLFESRSELKSVF